MIISRTPFRISLAGGGTDLKDFYHAESGAVTSMAIDKYMYITINKRFDKSIRISYSQTEIVNHVDEVRHPIVREVMKLTGVTERIEITSMADVPAGTGVGSSSSFTVGLLNALYAYQGVNKSAESLAEEACHVEIDLIKDPIGKQDQTIAAYGGIQHIQFNPDETVFVDPVICSKETKVELNRNLLLFYIGHHRKASSVLKEQKAHTEDKRGVLQKMRGYAVEIKQCLVEGKRLDRIGEILNHSWEYKKQLARKISNEEIDRYYNTALQAGALGGKVLGAGGGGFLLIYCERQKQSEVTKALSPLEVFEFSLEPQGSKIIYVEGQ